MTIIASGIPGLDAGFGVTAQNHRNQTALALASSDNVLAVRGGVASGLALSKGSSMTGTIGLGRGGIAAVDPRQGVYTVAIVDDETFTLTPSDTNRNRIDVVGIRVADAATDGGATTSAAVEVVAGAYSSGVPTQPETSGSFLPLWAIPVNSNTSSWSLSSAVDLRQPLEGLAAPLKAGIPYREAAGVLAVPAVALNGSWKTTVSLPAGRFSVQPIMSLTSGSGRLNTWWAPDPTAPAQRVIIGADNWSNASAAASTLHWRAVQMTKTAAAG